jgi:hypothetical protein
MAAVWTVRKTRREAPTHNAALACRRGEKKKRLGCSKNCCLIEQIRMRALCKYYNFLSFPSLAVSLPLLSECADYLRMIISRSQTEMFRLVRPINPKHSLNGTTQRQPSLKVVPCDRRAAPPARLSLQRARCPRANRGMRQE